MPNYVHTIRPANNNTEFYLRSNASEAGLHSFDLDNIQGQPVVFGANLVPGGSNATTSLVEAVNYNYDTNGSLGNWYNNGASAPSVFGGYGVTNTTNSFSPITGLGGMYGDDSIFNINLNNFSFPFFGTNYSSLQVSTNGVIFFGGNGVTSTNPGTGNELFINRPCIAAAWKDLYANNIYIDNALTYFSFRWNGTVYGTSDTIDFSVTLHSNGNISMKYSAGHNNNMTALVGISKGDGITYYFSSNNGDASLNGIPDINWNYVLTPTGIQDTYQGGRQNLLRGVSTQWLNVPSTSGSTNLTNCPWYVFVHEDLDPTYEYVDIKKIGSDTVYSYPLSTYGTRTTGVALNNVGAGIVGNHSLYSFNSGATRWNDTVSQVRLRTEPPAATPTPTPTPSISSAGGSTPTATATPTTTSTPTSTATPSGTTYTPYYIGYANGVDLSAAVPGGGDAVTFADLAASNATTSSFGTLDGTSEKITRFDDGEHNVHKEGGGGTLTWITPEAYYSYDLGSEPVYWLMGIPTSEYTMNTWVANGYQEYISGYGDVNNSPEFIVFSGAHTPNNYGMRLDYTWIMTSGELPPTELPITITTSV